MLLALLLLMAAGRAGAQGQQVPPVDPDPLAPHPQQQAPPLDPEGSPPTSPPSPPSRAEPQAPPLEPRPQPLRVEPVRASPRVAPPAPPVDQAQQAPPPERVLPAAPLEPRLQAPPAEQARQVAPTEPPPAFPGVQRRPFVLYDWGAAVGLEYEYFRHVDRAKEGTRTVIERTIFSQILGLTFDAYSFDPRLLRYHLDLELENDCIRGIYDTPFQTNIPRRTSTRGQRINYDLLVHVLPERSESVSFWARRHDYNLNELLFDIFEIRQNVYGARFDSRNQFLPFSFLVETRDTEERGLFEESTEDTDLARFQARKDFSDHNRLEIDAEYLRRRRVTTGELRSPERLEISENTQRADIYHDYLFGTDLRSNLSSRLSYFDQKGTFPYRNFLSRERLILWHRPNFQTDFGTMYQDTRIGTRDVKTGQIEAGLRHRLYENLITRLQARARSVEESTFSYDELDLLGNWNYWRHTPWGRLLITYFIQNTARESNSGIGGSNILTNHFEVAHEFTNFLRVYYRLDDQRIDIETASGDESDLDINGDGVVDQNDDTDGDGDIDDDDRHALPGTDADFDNIEIRTRVGQSIGITQSTRHTIGYEFPWRQFAFLQEYRKIDDDFNQINALRTEARAVFNMPYRGSLNMRLTHEDIRYRELIEDTRLIIGQVGYVTPVGRTGIFELEALYADQVGITDEREMRLRSGLQWRWRKLRVDFQGQYGKFETTRSIREGTHLLLSVSRTIR
jgi:hypothetical protein